MTDDERADPIAELADRLEATEFEFRIDWEGLTDEERDQLVALLLQRIAHRDEELEAVDENVRALESLYRLWLRSDCPADITLTEAIGSGEISLQEVIEAITAPRP